MKYTKSKLYQLVAKESPIDSYKVTSSKEAFRYATYLWDDDSIEIYESFFIILLNNSNKIKGHAKISQGGIDTTVVDPILVAKYAIDALAKGVVLVHNHPSGELKPSSQDRKLTSDLKHCLNMFHIQVLDHLIVNPTNYYSFADNGDL